MFHSARNSVQYCGRGKAMVRLQVCFILGLFVWTGFAVFAPPSRAGSETIHIVSPGIWFREGDHDQGHCNNVVIEMKDYLVIVDANYPSGAEGVMRDVKYMSPK